MSFKTFLAGTTALLCCAASPVLAADPAPLKVKSVEFTPTPAPSTEVEMVTPYTTSSVEVTLADGTSKSFPLSYEVLHRSGDFINGGYAGPQGFPHFYFWMLLNDLFEGIDHQMSAY